MDYSFFDDGLQARFTDRLNELGIAWEVFADPIDGWQVRVSDDVPDEPLDEIEALYDELLAEHTRLGREEWVTKRVAGVQVNLPEGGHCMIALEADLANRLLANFTPLEMAEIVDAVAKGLRLNHQGPLCCMPGEAETRG
ncbi:MAG: hypothetical protein PHU46_10355 [Rhodocyclaceae bacterium]|nr:hypothetical protein [Rhodocyclaceae bacterium]